MQAGDMEGKSEKMTQQEEGNDRVKRLSAPVKRSLFKCHLLRSYLHRLLEDRLLFGDLIISQHSLPLLHILKSFLRFLHPEV